MSWPDGVVVRRGEPLARHLPWRVGGPCDAWIVVHRREALADTIACCREEGWNRTVLGTGSRVVVRDGGLAGAVIRLGLGFDGVTDDGDAAWVGAATPLARVAALLGEAGARLRHAPGTLGGSLACDPGWEPWLDRVRVVGRGAEKEAAWSEVGPLGSVVITAARIRRSVAAPPPGPRFGHTWFVAPEDADPAVSIREASLAGTRLRGVLLPSVAPSLLVNVGGADARDLHLIQRSVIERVATLRGVTLTDRMQWMGRSS